MQLFTSSLCTCTREVIRHFYFQLFPFQQKEKPKVRTFVGKVIRTEARRTCVFQVRFSICLLFSSFSPPPSLCLFSPSLPPSFSMSLPSLSLCFCPPSLRVFLVLSPSVFLSLSPHPSLYLFFLVLFLPLYLDRYLSLLRLFIATSVDHFLLSIHVPIAFPSFYLGYNCI